MRKLTKPLSILLSMALMIGMLTIVPAAQASAAEIGSAVGDDPGSYSYDAQSGELRLLSGDFSRSNKWGSDVSGSLVKSVTAEDGVTFSGDCSGLFKNFVRCVRIDLSKVNTDAVTNTSEMFMSCESLKKLDISGFDMSNVNDASGMFIDTQVLSVITLPPKLRPMF